MADDYWSQGLEIAEAIDAPFLEAMIWSDIAVFSNDRGDLDLSQDSARIALDIYQKIHSMRGETMSLRTLADVEFLRGNLEDAEALIRKATDLALETGDAVYMVWCKLNLVRCLIARSKFSDAEPIAHECLDQCLEMNEVGFLPDAYIYLAQIELSKKDIDQATRYIDLATSTVADEDVWTWTHACYVKGSVLVAQGQLAEAEARMQMAYEKSHSGNTKLMSGYTSLEYARVLYLSRKLKGAMQLATESKELFSDMGMRLKLEETLDLISSIEHFIQLQKAHCQS